MLGVWDWRPSADRHPQKPAGRGPPDLTAFSLTARRGWSASRCRSPFHRRLVAQHIEQLRARLSNRQGRQLGQGRHCARHIASLAISNCRPASRPATCRLAYRQGQREQAWRRARLFTTKKQGRAQKGRNTMGRGALAEAALGGWQDLVPERRSFLHHHAISLAAFCLQATFTRHNTTRLTSPKATVG